MALHDEASLAAAVAAFDEGRLVAIPTETVYGLAAPVDRPELVERIFQLKGRPPGNPLIVHVASREQARACVSEWPDLAEELASHFWPGPLTLVLPKSAWIADRISAGQPTVALRMPDHSLTLAFIRALGRPIVAPSANLFTRLSPTTAADVVATFPNDQVLVLDGGACQVGIESTIVAIDGPARTLWWLRPGRIGRAALRALLPPGWRLAEAKERPGGELGSPGRMQAHYRPDKPLRVHVVTDPEQAGRLRCRLDQDPRTFRMELPGHPEAAARCLYASLRRAELGDNECIDLIVPQAWLAAPVWEGVINRLRKAASEWREPVR